MVKKLMENAIMLDNGIVLEKERLGIFKMKKDSEEIGKVEITPERITLTEFLKERPYLSYRGNVEFVDGKKRIVFDADAKKVLELHTPQNSLSLFEKNEVWITDRLVKNGEQFFRSFSFNLDESARDMRKLLKQPLVKEDYEKIKEMKKLK
jgi:hypothetical protein